jgi:hypothetical protein
MCGGGGGSKKLGKAAKMQAELAKESLAWFKDQYAATAPDRAKAADTAEAISGEQLNTMRLQNGRAEDLYAFDKQYTRPIQERLSTEAMAYDTPERRAAAASAAAADVQMASSNQQDQLNRNLARQGVNPGSGAAMALQTQGALQTAAASAGAQNVARQQVENIGYARMSDAANGGAQMVNQGNQSAQLALGASQAALGSSNSRLAAVTSGMPGMQQAFNTSGQLMSSAGSLYGQQAQAGDNSGMWGSLAGSAMTAGAIYM